MLSLYDILKASKTGIAPDMWTALAGANFGGSPTPTEHEYTGIVPYSFNANGEPLLDWYIKGNTVQSTAPTPTTPIMPQETGERTGNLAPPLLEWVNGYVASNGWIAGPSETYKEKSSDYILIDAGKAYTFSMENGFPGGTYYSWRAIGWYAQDKTFISRTSGNANVALSTNAPSNAVYCRLSYRTHGETTNSTLNTGSTPLSYEPYGYKIPISSASTTTPVYLGQVQTTRIIGKYEFTGQETFGEYTNLQVSRIGVYVQFTDMKADMRNSGYSSHFIPIKSPSQNTVNGITFGASNNYIYFTFSLDTAAALNLTDLNSIKQWFAQQYAAGTPVCVWYVLTEPTTGVVNEPLMKIGEYADTLSMEQAGVSIPTNNGSTTVDVETTLKPSEVYIKWKGV